MTSCAFVSHSSFGACALSAALIESANTSSHLAIIAHAHDQCWGDAHAVRLRCILPKMEHSRFGNELVDASSLVSSFAAPEIARGRIAQAHRGTLALRNRAEGGLTAELAWPGETRAMSAGRNPGSDRRRKLEILHPFEGTSPMPAQHSLPGCSLQHCPGRTFTC